MKIGDFIRVNLVDLLNCLSSRYSERGEWKSLWDHLVVYIDRVLSCRFASDDIFIKHIRS